MVLNYFSVKANDLSELNSVGCDECCTGTREDNWIMKIFEKTLETPIQWVIFELHGNEVPLKLLFKKLDSETFRP